MYDDLGKLSHLDKSKLNFVIWTTTIWTLPGNLAIALHPQEEYAVVRADGGEMYIMARPLVEKVMKIGGVEHYEIVETHPGAFFENMLASHPFLPKTSRLVLADYVTMDSGTGCVHTAPRLRCRRLSDLPALRYGYGGAGGRSGPPHRLCRQVRRDEDRGV